MKLVNRSILFLIIFVFGNAFAEVKQSIQNEKIKELIKEDACLLQNGSTILGAECLLKKIKILDDVLQDKNNEIKLLVEKIYGANKGSSEYGSEYVQELLGFQNKANQSWKEYRDSKCYAESYIDGMSRREIGNISESCRLLMTEQKILEVNNKLSNLK